MYPKVCPSTKHDFSFHIKWIMRNIPILRRKEKKKKKKREKKKERETCLSGVSLKVIICEQTVDIWEFSLLGRAGNVFVVEDGGFRKIKRILNALCPADKG